MAEKVVSQIEWIDDKSAKYILDAEWKMEPVKE